MIRRYQLLCSIFCGFLFIGPPIAAHAEAATLSGYPLGLFPGESIQDVRKTLTRQGLKVYRTSGPFSDPRMMLWQLSGQLAYKDFAPTLFNTKFVGGKLSAVWLGNMKVTSCDNALRAYRSAYEFVKTQYAVSGTRLLDSAGASLTCDEAKGNLAFYRMVITKDFKYSVEATGEADDYMIHLYYEAQSSREK